jgi:cell division protein FtsQ
MLSAVALAVAGGRYFLLHDDRFLVAGSSQIEVDGNAHLTRAQVLSVFAGDLERNIFRMSLAERRADLERLPWVQHATVMRLLPDHIRVAITERVPVAFVKQGTELGLVDAGGVLLDMPPQDAGDPRYSFPVLTGIAASDALEVRASRMAVYKQFMQELDGAGEKLSAQVSEVDVSNPEDVKALVASGGMDILVHFGHEQFLARFKEFALHLGDWKQQYPKLASADMRYEGQVVLEMQQGAPVPVNGDGSAAAASDASAAPAAVPATAKPAAAVVSPAAHGGKPKPKPTKKVVAKKAAPVKAGAKKKNVELVTP